LEMNLIIFPPGMPATISSQRNSFEFPSFNRLDLKKAKRYFRFKATPFPKKPEKEDPDGSRKMGL
jgi:hypothetical protein